MRLFKRRHCTKAHWEAPPIWWTRSVSLRGITIVGDFNGRSFALAQNEQIASVEYEGPGVTHVWIQVNEGTVPTA